MAQDLDRYFQAEAEDLLRRITAALERLREESVTPEALRDLRRWAHTLKGAAQVVRREDIAAGAHRLETLLDRIAEPGENAGSDGVALSLAAEMRNAVLHPSAPATPATGTPGVEEEIASLRVELRDLDTLLQSVNESGIVAASLRRLFGPLERAKDLVSLLRRETRAESRLRNGAHADLLAEELGEVIAQAGRELDLTSQNIQREIDALRLQTENLRLVRAETIAPILKKSVQAAAAATGREVAFELTGGELELDAHLLNGARDALLQLVRNAVAHGIENPADRVAAGKPPIGTVRVNFRRSGSRNVLSVVDDGRGIDFEALRREAVRRGWMKEAEAEDASAQQLTEILLRPGVSTVRSANALAGRGVGLDLVSSAVARMKGDLRISAERGKGTTVIIRIPATMNTALVLMLKAGPQIFGVPLDAVGRTAAIAGLPVLSDRLVVDGRPLPMIPLAAAVGAEAAAPTLVVEIPADPHGFLLGVDGLAGIRQTVIHTLPEYVEAEPWVLGATVEADGNLRLILDPALLASRRDAFSHLEEKNAQQPHPQLPILVVDDSMTTRMLEQSIFEMEGYTVDLASSAEEALTMARQRQYGLFLVDVEMPGVDGIAFVERTQKEPNLRNTPAILVTSRGAPADRARGLEAGARDYMVKSEFDQRFLLKRVRELMRAR